MEARLERRARMRWRKAPILPFTYPLRECVELFTGDPRGARGQPINEYYLPAL
jgi:hypothetical protein